MLLWFRLRLLSFRYALNGWRVIWHSGWNIRIHALATVGVVVAGLVRHCSRSEWLVLCFAVTGVWVAEAFNTAIEQLCDYACDMKQHPAIKKVKDIAAGAVLIAALGAAFTGFLIFIY